MTQEELWLDCAEKLTAMIQQIIEFAKLIPGFMRLSQDDQVSRSYLFASGALRRVVLDFAEVNDLAVGKHESTTNIHGVGKV